MRRIERLRIALCGATRAISSDISGRTMRRSGALARHEVCDGWHRYEASGSCLSRARTQIALDLDRLQEASAKSFSVFVTFVHRKVRAVNPSKLRKIADENEGAGAARGSTRSSCRILPEAAYPGCRADTGEMRDREGISVMGWRADIGSFNGRILHIRGARVSVNGLLSSQPRV